MAYLPLSEVDRALADRTDDRGGEMVHEHAYPTRSYVVQLAAAQLVMEAGGRTALPARPD